MAKWHYTQFFLLNKELLCIKSSFNALNAIARVTPSLPQRGRQPKGASPPDPRFRSFFRCVFTALLHGATVDRPRAPVVPSLSNTIPYRLSTEPKEHYCFFPVPPLSQSATSKYFLKRYALVKRSGTKGSFRHSLIQTEDVM